MELVKKVIKKIIGYKSPNEYDIFYTAVTFLDGNGIEGDYVEFGTYQGTSFIKVYTEFYNRLVKTPLKWGQEFDSKRKERFKRMRFFAFDSFIGLPKAKGIDKIDYDFWEGMYSCSEDKFKKNIENKGVPLDKVVTVPGFFKDTLNEQTYVKYNLTKTSLIMIDVDLYESAKEVLQFITPLLIDGTVIIFDDWYNFRGSPYRGEQKAFREYISSDTIRSKWHFSEYKKDGPFRNSFIVNKKEENL